MTHRIPELKIMVLKTGKKQYQIADALGWPDSKLSRFITGRPPVPSAEEVTALAAAINVPVKDLQDIFTESYKWWIERKQK